MSDIAAKATHILAEQLGIKPEGIETTSHFVKDLGVDSLDSVELILAFEDAFNIEIDDDAAERIVSIEHLMQFVADTHTVAA